MLGGFLIGFGLLALLRHRASVGGVNIVAQWLQQARGIGAGKVQMAVVVSAVPVLNHRPGRYLGV